MGAEPRAPETWVAGPAEYDSDTAGLRRSWWWALAFGAVVAAGTALVMRYEQATPAATLSPEVYGHALAIHGLAWLALLVAALIAIPAFVVRPGRAFTVLGYLALAAWTVAIVRAAYEELLAKQPWAGGSPRAFLALLAAAAALGATQLGLAARANASANHRPQLVAAIGGVAALAVVAIPMFAGRPPGALWWLVATTIAVGATLPDAVVRLGSGRAVAALMPCLVLAWTATALLQRSTPIHLHDTVAMVAPLPLTGGALFLGLLVSASRARTPQHGLAIAGAVLFMLGTALVSGGFLALGFRGLPRRYLAYLPEFQTLQVVVGLAAALSLVGCILAVAAFAKRRRS